MFNKILEVIVRVLVAVFAIGMVALMIVQLDNWQYAIDAADTVSEADDIRLLSGIVILGEFIFTVAVGLYALTKVDDFVHKQ